MVLVPSNSFLANSRRVASTTDALVALSRDASAPMGVARQAEVLARALSLVAVPCTVAAPTRARAALVSALDELAALLEQHGAIHTTDVDADADGASPAPVLSASDGGGASTQQQRQQLLRTGLLTLWARATTYALVIAIADLIAAIDFIPHALRFWKAQRRRPVRAAIQQNPLEWLKPESERITLDERIYSLESTLSAVLEKLGHLKDAATRLLHATDSSVDALPSLLAVALRQLELAYSSTGVAPPRKGHGAFKTLAPLEFASIQLDLATIEVTAASVRQSLVLLHTNVARLDVAREKLARSFHDALAPCRVPSKLRQRWLHLAVTVACVAGGAAWIARNQREFQDAVEAARAAFEDFLTEHMIEPMQAIVAEVLLNQKPEIQDAAALRDTKESLRRMLSDFVRDTNPTTNSEELQRVVREMDMSVVSLQYEKQIGNAVRNLMSGDIVRMLLIQVQFIKKELMVAMGAIDELMHANQLNLQMMATVPTFLVFGGAYQLAKELFFQVYRRTSERLFYDPAKIAGFLRNILRDIERLLNKQNRGSASASGRAGAAGVMVDDVLGARDMGLLMLLLHQLRDVFDAYKDLFRDEEQERFDEDLNDLIEEGLLVSQQLAVIQRMYHSHPFLQRTKVSRWLLH
ncbi:hypothetical protein ATCC90586_007092 [Pythium insidiosum]|nr:hypothetical protein ATCC90586_007092 [Pythium insidiosum]